MSTVKYVVINVVYRFVGSDLIRKTLFGLKSNELMERCVCSADSALHDGQLKLCMRQKVDVVEIGRLYKRIFFSAQWSHRPHPIQPPQK